MVPVLRPGEKVALEMWPATIRPGQIGVFGEVVHRLILVDPWGGLWEQGDAVGAPLRRRLRHELVGIAFAVYRDGRWLDLPVRRPSRRALAQTLVRTGLRRLRGWLIPPAVGPAL